MHIYCQQAESDQQWNNSMADAMQEQDDASEFSRHIMNDPRRIAQYTVRNNDGVHLVAAIRMYRCHCPLDAFDSVLHGF